MNKITTTIVGSLAAAILLLASASPLQAGVASTGVTGITDVVLTFSPANGGTPVVVRAQDPDGAGSAGLQVLEAINLSESTSYTLGVSVLNSVAMENLTAEILAKGVEYQLFFGFSTGLFQSPLGDGNIGEAAASLGYADTDSLGLPIGLITQWSSACVEGNVSGSFRLVLKHQPGLKSASSTVETGTTDFDLTFTLNVAEDPNAPPCENEEEVIDRVTLTFTPVGGGTPVVAVASDPDGPGPLDLTVGEIRLQESTEYNLGIKVENTIEGEDITEEILSEAADHLWLFGFTEGLFSSPAGDGNADNRGDQVNYRDSDINGLPLGLSTQWQTACGESNVSGSFRIVLKHQPDGLKTAGSGIETGGTDLDLVWPIVVAEDPNAPPCENEEEVIDRVTLTFTPVGGGTPVVAVASDPDGPGPLDLTVEDVALVENTTYDLTLKVENTIEGENITEEIAGEAADHLFFFGWTGNIFSNPAGNGNLDNRQDSVNYNDQDINGLPLGLSTRWTTAVNMGSGTLRVILKHQPDGQKTANSTIDVGGTDLDLTWNIRTVVTQTNDLERRGLKLTLSPNPAQSLLNWELSDRSVLEKDYQVVIYNQYGQVVMMQRNPTATFLHIETLSKGIYYFSIHNGREIYSNRFVKLD